MRKIVAAVVAMLTFVAVGTAMVTIPFTNVSAETKLIGDTNQDGKIETSDAYNMLLVYAKNSAGIPVEYDIGVYDVNEDGKVSTEDAYQTLLYYATICVGGQSEWPPIKKTETTTTQETIPTTTTSTTEAGFSASYAGTYHIINSSYLNVRKGPSTATDKIGQLSADDPVEVISADGKWAKINYNGGIAYVSMSYLELEVTTDATTTTTKETIPVPTTTTTIVSTTEVTTTGGTNVVLQFENGDILRCTSEKEVYYDISGDIRTAVEPNETVVVISWLQDSWYAVELSDGTVGYINAADSIKYVGYTFPTKYQQKTWDKIQVGDTIAYFGRYPISTLKYGDTSIVKAKSNTSIELGCADGTTIVVNWTDFCHDFFFVN